MDEPVSKSQKKREAEALQKLGTQLIALNPDKIELLPLSDPLKQAILEAKTLKSHGAVRRHAQWIGKLMRSIDSKALITAYARIIGKSPAHIIASYRLEHLYPSDREDTK